MSAEEHELMKLAIEARNQAHAPYSRYLVGSAVLDDRGRMHVGCNVENTAFPQGSCAEANAIAAMVVAGGSRIVRIAVAGGSENLETCTPCGGCRQRILEFADERTRVDTLTSDGRTVTFSVAELLPDSIKPV